MWFWHSLFQQSEVYCRGALDLRPIDDNKYRVQVTKESSTAWCKECSIRKSLWKSTNFAESCLVPLSSSDSGFHGRGYHTQPAEVPPGGTSVRTWPSPDMAGSIGQHICVSCDVPVSHISFCHRSIPSHPISALTFWVDSSLPGFFSLAKILLPFTWCQSCFIPWHHRGAFMHLQSTNVPLEQILHRGRRKREAGVAPFLGDQQGMENGHEFTAVSRQTKFYLCSRA